MNGPNHYVSPGAVAPAHIGDVFHHTQFTGVNGEITSPRFGTVNNARPPRIGQLSVKLIW